MKSTIKIIHKDIDSNCAVLEFEDIESGVFYYIIWDNKQEKFVEISIALPGKAYYTRKEWKDLDLEWQNTIDEVLTEYIK